MKDKHKRIDNYKKLRAVGYTSYEANKYKDRKQSIIDDLIAKRKRFNDTISEVTK